MYFFTVKNIEHFFRTYFLHFLNSENWINLKFLNRNDIFCRRFKVQFLSGNFRFPFYSTVDVP